MESIVFDVVAQQGSARIATLTVPSPAPAALEMSSLVLVSRIEDLGEAFTPSSAVIAPLYVGRTLIYPNLGEPIARSASSELPFYFTLYGTLDGVKASAELLRNGQRLAEAPNRVTALTAVTRPAHRQVPDRRSSRRHLSATDPRERRPAGGRAHGLLHHSRLKSRYLCAWLPPLGGSTQPWQWHLPPEGGSHIISGSSPDSSTRRPTSASALR